MVTVPLDKKSPLHSLEGGYRLVWALKYNLPSWVLTK
jgi:hypothetical protein